MLYYIYRNGGRSYEKFECYGFVDRVQGKFNRYFAKN